MAAPGFPHCAVRLWDDKQYNATLGFELAEVPGNRFKIIPFEWLSDDVEPIIPYHEHALTSWIIGDAVAGATVELPDGSKVETAVKFASIEGGIRIRVRTRFLNLCGRTRRNANLFSCLAFHEASDFADPDLTRTYVRIGQSWASIADLSTVDYPAEGMMLFVMDEGYESDDFWVLRKFEHLKRQQLVSEGSVCVESSNGQWTAGMTTDDAANIFVNSTWNRDYDNWQCIHANPLIGTVETGAVGEGNATVLFVRGGRDRFLELAGNKRRESR